MESSYTLSQYGRIYNPPNWYYNPNHLTNRIYYIVGGKAMYKDRIKLKPGFLYIFRASPSFKVSQDPLDPVDHFYFDFITLGLLLEQDIIEIDIRDNDHLKKIVSLICDELNNKKCPWEVGQAYFNLLTYELQDYLVENIVYSELTGRVLKLIHTSKPDELSVSSIASLLNMNENHIIRTFKKDTGTTPHKYINQIKANLAISFLQQGLTLDDIAEKLGFSSVSSLSVFFKTTTNRNMNRYRR